jgi:deoxynucleoside triphosphate triphosphohydrolase SAMHD1
MSKIIYDPIHKYMKLDSILLKIIDTIEFQKLKNIKQLGLCYYVFPGASHNRFEHSIGVAYLSGLLIETLQINQPELNITNRTILLVKIAGLVHDIGHACFSHFYDHLFLKDKIPDSKYKEHEYRSCQLFEYIVNKYKIGLTSSEINFVKRLIDPLEDDTTYIYQIVANKLNGLDCDKFDYIARDTYNIGLSYSFDSSRLIKEARVIDNIICFPKKCYFDISDLYYTRYKLHKQIYTHNAVRSIEYMVFDIIKELDKDINFIEKTINMDQFHYLTDNILDLSYFFNNEKAIEIYNNIKLRKLYKFVNEVQEDKFDLDGFRKKIDDLELNNIVIIDKIRLNYSMDEKNPLKFVELYEDVEIINKDNLSFLFPQTFEEKIIKFYIKDRVIYNDIYNLIELFIK